MTSLLTEIIGKEAALFETFLRMLERQQAMLIKNDADGVGAVTEAIREKLVEAQSLGRQREDEIERIKTAHAVDGDLTVTKLLGIVDQAEADQLSRLRNLVLSLHDQINRVRNQNATLINRSRESIARMMEMLSRVNGPDPTYVRSGELCAGGANVSIDRRV